MFKRYLFLVILFIQILAINACNKLVDVSPPVTGTSGAAVFKQNASAIGALTAIYTRICEKNMDGGDINSLSLFPGLSADEWVSFNQNSPSIMAYYQNNLNVVNSSEYWNVIYPVIYIANAAIEGLEASTSLTDKVKQQLLGEAKFMRAFCYFYLTNLYGDIPLVLSTDYKANAILPKSNTSKVIAQMINDLKEAKSLLDADYLDGTLLKNTADRIRPNSWVATALLARVYLFSNDYRNAELQSDIVIANKTMYDTVPLNDVFLKNSKEAIWQLPPVVFGRNTQDAWMFILPETGPNLERPFYLNNQLVGGFEFLDKRKNEWVDSVTNGVEMFFFPKKYKINDITAPITEYHMVLRIAELYLIRAESRAHQGNIAGALDDINVIRKRAGLSDIVTADVNILMAEILEQRRFELFTEWGHRWFDLKRTNSVDSVMSRVAPEKGGEWKSYKRFYPIPQADVLANPNIKQNDGY